MFFTMIRLGKNVSPRDVALLSKGGGYQSHRQVWNLFTDSPVRTRDFLYRHETVNGWPTFYTVSERSPRDATGLWEIFSKPYAPKLFVGQRLAFTLRVNPIRSKRDELGRQHRHDVIMEAKTVLKTQGERIDESEIIQNQGERWLMERCERFGFHVPSGNVRVDGYQQHKLFKGKGNKPITFSTLDFTGVLIVDQPDKFIKECLFSGIGPVKGFGCGLMLIRRV
ncbi:MAG: type I-E CRISPR-associated protein Cas6/Cse3/CasE [Syntrophobacteraceae bacterium]|nr:type I-E CRISPR-associated protein Cas6/Cse3/CasE [Syntrophobacteraceae bacterium]